MDPKYLEFMLESEEAFPEFKKLMIEEYGDKYGDYELREMGARLLAWADMMTSPVEDEATDEGGDP
jgi:RNase P/RNase MRP subunit POP5